MGKRSREQWQADIEARQRNIVFPDTANNEARFWRNALDGKTKLTPAQIAGITVMWLAVIALFVVIISLKGGINAVIGLTACGLAFLLLRWRVRVSLRKLADQRREKQ